MAGNARRMQPWSRITAQRRAFGVFVACNHSATAMHRYRPEQRGLGLHGDWPGEAGVAPSARGSAWRFPGLAPNGVSTAVASSVSSKLGWSLFLGGGWVLWIRCLPRRHALGTRLASGYGVPRGLVLLGAVGPSQPMRWPTWSDMSTLHCLAAPAIGSSLPRTASVTSCRVRIGCRSAWFFLPEAPSARLQARGHVNHTQPGHR
jgi:hypothetical protein